MSGRKAKANKQRDREKGNKFTRNSFAKEFTINGIKVTDRELDVLACFVNNPGSISNILEISPKTVDVHIRNATAKLGCTKRVLPKIIEKSDQVKFLKEHYLILRARTEFRYQLDKISRLARERISCSLMYDEAGKDNAEMLAEHLKEENSGLKVGQSIKNLNEFIEKKVKSDASLNYLLYFLPLGKSEEEIRTLIHEINLRVKKVIFIDTRTTPIRPNELYKQFDNIIKINFEEEKEYYLDFLKMLNLLTRVIDIDISKYIKELSNIIYNIEDDAAKVPKHVLLDEIKNYVKQLFYNKIGSWIRKPQNIFTLVVLFSTIISWFFIYTPGNPKAEISTEKKIEKIAKEITTLAESGFSADNAEQKNRKRNYEKFKEAEDIEREIDNNKDLQAYFHGKEIKITDLLNYVYILLSLSNHYTYNFNDGVKIQEARQKLEQAKELLENYVTYSMRIGTNFKHLKSMQEKYNELRRYESMPEMYTRVVYTLGRILYFFLDKSNQNLAEEYLELSGFIGGKTKIFEGYLSNRSGLGVIMRHKAELHLQNRQYDKAREELNNVISLYETLMNDNNAYKKDYRTRNASKEIKPAEDVFNKTISMEQIVKCYKSLVKATNDQNEKAEYLLTGFYNVTGGGYKGKHYKGIYHELKDASKHKAAAIYNVLGDLLLESIEITDKSIDVMLQQSRILEKLKIHNLKVVSEQHINNEPVAPNSLYIYLDNNRQLCYAVQNKVRNITKGQIATHDMDADTLKEIIHALTTNKELNDTETAEIAKATLKENYTLLNWEKPAVVSNRLKIAENLFRLALKKSSSIDYARADAYGGLVRTYIKAKTINNKSAEEIEALDKKIKELRIKEQETNTSMRRVSRITQE